MKQFSCGDVVPGCGRVFRGSDGARFLDEVAEHARGDHGLSVADADLLELISAHSITAPS